MVWKSKISLFFCPKNNALLDENAFMWAFYVYYVTFA